MNPLRLEFAASTALVAGVDEAGRGPLAGPVYAAAVILDDRHAIDGLADSKTMTAAARERVARDIRRCALATGIAHADITEIDSLNILYATLLAMTRAVALLAPQPGLVLVDGNRAPALPCPVRSVVKGDRLVAAISAASILAKVARDEEMRAMDRLYPGYGFAQHKGYPTALHLKALRRLGVCPIHRRSYAPVQRILLEYGATGERR